MRKSYWQYINSLISPESVYNGCQQQKRFWSYIRSLKKDDTEISSLHTSDGLITDNNEKAEILNTQFKSVFSVEPNKPLPDKGPSSHPTMPDILVSQFLELKVYCITCHSAELVHIFFSH